MTTVNNIQQGQSKKSKGPKLCFEINQTRKGRSDGTQNGPSTFAELSKKLEEKKMKNKKKNGFFKNAFIDTSKDDSERKLPPLQDHIQTIKGDLIDYDVVDIELEESFKHFKDQQNSVSPKSHTSRSRSRSKRKSRSRSGSGTSRSHSRSSYGSRSS